MSPRCPFLFRLKLAIGIACALAAAPSLVFSGSKLPDTSQSPAESSELTIYVYDSFFSGAPREKLAKAIQSATQHSVNWVVVGDSGQLISRHSMDLRRKKPRAHLLIGVDQSTFGQVEPLVREVTEAEVPSLTKVEKRFRFSPKFVPFNYGVLAFMADTEKLPKDQWPKKWEDLLKPELRKKLLLQDPRTSTPGLGFLLGSRAVVGDDFSSYWSKLKNQWLTLSPGWSQAYGLFQKGEAPLVWSYTTSQAYHQLADQPTSRYQAIVFEDGNPLQIEGVVLPTDAPGGESARKAALKAMDVLLSESVQLDIPRAQWMIPVRKGVLLPWSGVKPSVPEPVKVLDLQMGREKQDAALKAWSKAIR